MEETEPSKKRKIAYVLLIAFGVALFARIFFIEGVLVAGDSMNPLIQSGEYVFINKFAYAFKEPQRGDVVVAIPQDYERRVVKRLIGMPGDWIEVVEGKVLLRTKRLNPSLPYEESYVATSNGGPDMPTRVIDPKEYFALGDNREVSVDSRELGPVNLWDIKGKVFLIFNFKTFRFKTL